MVDDTPPSEIATERVQVIVDRDACMGSGNCTYWAPNVFELDDNGIALVVGDFAGDEEAVRAAMSNCPTSAIKLIGE